MRNPDLISRILLTKGIDVNDRHLSSDDYLNAAVHQDDEAAYVGPHDPMFIKHIIKRNDYLKAAEILESRNAKLS